jgi:hypothetical protein
LKYLQPSDANVIQLMQRSIEGPVVMLNLLRLRETADYTAHPDLDPGEPISGRDALQRYVDHTLPFLHASGGDLIYFGSGGSYLIGPPDEGWDAMMLVEQTSAKSFLEFASNDEYLKGMGHRDAAVIDSRILPLETLYNRSSAE